MLTQSVPDQLLISLSRLIRFKKVNRAVTLILNSFILFIFSFELVRP